MTDEQMGITFAEYQLGTAKTAIYADPAQLQKRTERLKKIDPAVLMLGLVEVVGACSTFDKLKKFLRDGSHAPLPDARAPWMETGEEGRVRDLGVAKLYVIFGLLSEAGEVASVLLDYLDGRIDQEQAEKRLSKEAGDVLWYISETCTRWGLMLPMVASENLAKLADRQRRNVLGGSGDER